MCLFFFTQVQLISFHNQCYGKHDWIASYLSEVVISCIILLCLCSIIKYGALLLYYIILSNPPLLSFP